MKTTQNHQKVNKMKKETKKILKGKIALSLVMIIMIPIVTVVMTFLHPSVGEAVLPHLGECDIYYNEEFIECMTWGEALKINFTFISIAILIFILVLFFIPHKYLKDKDTKSSDCK